MRLSYYEMRQERAAFLNKAEGVIAQAEAGKRALTAEESKLFDAHMAEANRLTAQIMPIESVNTLSKQFSEQGPGFLLSGGAARSTDPRVPLVNMERFDMELGNFMRGKISATDSPIFIGTGGDSTSIGDTVPKEVLAYLPAYYNLDSFALAGARVIHSDNTVPQFLPVISSGPEASSYAEGASASESKPFALDGFTLGGAKYSRLVKVSEESLMNSALPLQGAILDELTAGLATTFTRVITTALLAAIASNSAVRVAEGSYDPYRTLLALMHAVPPRFASPTNKWMLSRKTLAAIKDSRAVDSGVPFFDPESGQIFGRVSVINDNLSSGQVIYGDWGSGAIVRKSPFFLLPLREAFSSTGEVGFKCTQWVDSHFLAELTSVAVQPLYSTVLEEYFS
jgi:HK97 family phage major capsid protein